MCGIAGIIGKEKQDFGSRLTDATASLKHRGPECQQHWYNETKTTGLGHCRLSIIDPSERSRQPFHYLERFTIVHNGELYNYRELRSELKQQGYSFTTESDTEVIIAAYAAWGKKCLSKFDGMFAFAIWDEVEKILFAARDRFGEKPFFYHYEKGTLKFASEIAAIWKMGVKKDVNRAMLYNFLSIGYTSNPGDQGETFYNGIRKLPAANFLLFTPSKNQLTLERYWELDNERQVNISDEEAIEQFDALMSESVRLRMRSDVSIGTSLSGGLDSSSIVAYCQKFSNEHYSHKCFTAVFPGYEKNEEEHAKLVSKKFGLDQELVKIYPGEVRSLMQKVMQHQQAPIGSASAIAQYKVFEAAKASGITVLLDGQGADEILGGYHKFYKWRWQELYRNKMLQKSGELEAAKEIGIKEKFDQSHKIAALFPHLAVAFLQSKKARSFPDKDQLNEDFIAKYKNHSYYSLPSHFTLNSALYFDTVTYGLEELLRIADRNSMAHAIEVRLPFLSHKLVEFIFSLPPEFKIRKGWTKWILRKSSEKYLPAEISWRKDKIGFEPPQKLWTAEREVLHHITAAKDSLSGRGILKYPEHPGKKVQPHEAFAAVHNDWKYWSASLLF